MNAPHQDDGHDLDAWPDVLRQFAQVIGPELTLRLAQTCGGIDRVFIPRTATPEHPWAAAIGLDAFRRIVGAHGGERVDLPRGAFVRLRKRQIFALGGQGLSHQQIALRAGVTERYVRSVLGATRPAVDGRQTTLKF